MTRGARLPKVSVNHIDTTVEHVIVLGIRRGVAPWTLSSWSGFAILGGIMVGPLGGTQTPHPTVALGVELRRRAALAPRAVSACCALGAASVSALLIFLPGAALATTTVEPAEKCSTISTSPNPALSSEYAQPEFEVKIKLVAESSHNPPTCGAPVREDNVKAEFDTPTGLVHLEFPNRTSPPYDEEETDMNGEVEALAVDPCGVYGCKIFPVESSELQASDEHGVKLHSVFEYYLYELPATGGTVSTHTLGGDLKATASGGGGSLGLGRAPAPGTPPTTFESDGEYLEVSLSAMNTFSKLELSVCGIPSSPTPTLYWDDGGSWPKVAIQSYNSGNGCIEVEIRNAPPANTYSPELSQIDGAVFGVGTPVPLTKPSVTKEPEGTAVTAGDAVSFTAEASGDPTPTVQWEVSTNGGLTFEDVPGATSDTYAIASAEVNESGNEYEAVFKNSQGEATSEPATLTVSPPKVKPSVSRQPVSEMVTAGEPAAFTAEATGNPSPSVQWWVSTNGGVTFEEIAGATADEYSIPSTAITESSNEYEAVFKNSQGETTSEPATLTVNLALTEPLVSEQPQSVMVTAGQAATFKAAAAGNPAPTAQWWVSKHGSAFEEVSGATSGSFTIGSAQLSESGDQYEAVFTNSQGKATSEPATLTVQSSSSGPVNSGLPMVSGKLQVGKTLSCSSGSWSGSPAPTFLYEWSRDGHAITEATSTSTYRVKAADEGHTLACTVTATNSSASASATSSGALVPLAGCSDYWINTAGGSWYTAGDWSTGAPPGAGEEACVLANGTYTVTMDQTLGPVSMESLKLGGEEGTQTLVVASTCAQSAELDSTAGISIAARGAMVLSNGDLCPGNVTLGGAVSNAGTLDIEAAHGGTRSINGSLSSSKILSLAAGVSLQVAGGYTQGPKATLQTFIAGSSGYGALSVSGAGKLEGGTLSVKQTLPFRAALGEEFAVLTAGSLTGAFAKETGDQISSTGLYYKPNYTAGGVTLKATQATLALSTGTGAPGATVTLTGSGYNPGDTITPTFTDHGEKTVYPAVKANSKGQIETEITTPALAEEGPATIGAKSTQTALTIKQKYKVT